MPHENNPGGPSHEDLNEAGPVRGLVTSFGITEACCASLSIELPDFCVDLAVGTCDGRVRRDRGRHAIT